MGPIGTAGTAGTIGTAGAPSGSHNRVRLLRRVFTGHFSQLKGANLLRLYPAGQFMRIFLAIVKGATPTGAAANAGAANAGANGTAAGAAGTAGTHFLPCLRVPGGHSSQSPVILFLR